MPRVSELYELDVDQGGLDFVDVLVETDNPVFVDPAAIRAQSGEWVDGCKAALQSFFAALIDAIRQNNEPHLRSLVYPLVEPNETHLGVSRGQSRGRSLGSQKKADDLIASLRRSRAVQTGMLSDLDDTALFVEGIGPDIVSDITTSVIRHQLIEYTRRMCLFYEIPMVEQVPSPTWDVDAIVWIETPSTELPRADGNYLLLVPRSIVRADLSADGGKYWRGYLRPYFVEEVLSQQNPAADLVRILRDKSVRVNLGELDKQLGTDKASLEEHTQKYPHALGEYKRVESLMPEPPLSSEALSQRLEVPQPDIRELLEQVLAIAPGPGGATLYHRSVAKLLRALFDVSLGNMKMETPLHNGIKRVDIMFDNIATKGFFRWLSLNWPAAMVPVECKNYTNDAANPEFDQLAMRFSNHRGEVGILMCRSFNQKGVALARARAAATDGHGFIILVDDDDLAVLVDEYEAQFDVAEGTPSRYTLLRERFDALVGA
jgi:hypothetical protein